MHRELTASGLNGAVLLDLLRMEDPLGVLSVFVEMPADGADRRAEIEIKNKLTHLEHRAGGNGSLLRAEALRSTLALVMPALERLLDPSTTGGGGAVFAVLNGPEIISLATPMPLASRVVLDSRPFVRPLLELLDEGEPAGVALTSAREAEVLDERLLISGDERLTGPLVDALPLHIRVNALLEARRLHEHDQPALAAAIAERLGQDRAGRNARNLADAGGIAALLRW